MSMNLPIPWLWVMSIQGIVISSLLWAITSACNISISYRIPFCHLAGWDFFVAPHLRRTFFVTIWLPSISYAAMGVIWESYRNHIGVVWVFVGCSLRLGPDAEGANFYFSLFAWFRALSELQCKGTNNSWSVKGKWEKIAK